MTIALGILATDGVVIAADTEESYGYAGGLKTNVSKILTLGQEGGRGEGWAPFAVAGAGDSGYIDALTVHLAMTFRSNQRRKYGHQLEALDKNLRTFYADHVIPFAGYPSQERPDVALLMAYCSGGMPQLFVTTHSAIRPVLHTYEAVGSGAAFAKQLLQRFHRGGTVADAQKLAAYVIMLTKDSVEGCGKHTDITTIYSSKSRGRIEGMDRLDVESLEQIFRVHYAAEEQRHFWDYLGRREQAIAEFEKFRRKRLNVRPSVAPESDQVAPQAPQSPKRGQKSLRPSRA